MPDATNEPSNEPYGAEKRPSAEWKGERKTGKRWPRKPLRKRDEDLLSLTDKEMIESMASDWKDMKTRRRYATLVFVFALAQIIVLCVQVLGTLLPSKYLLKARSVNSTSTPAAVTMEYSRDTLDYHILTCVQSVLVVFQLTFITRWYVFRVRTISYFDNIWKDVPLIFSTQRSSWVAEMIILSLHEPPFLVLAWNDAYKLQILALLRVYTAFTFLRGWSDTLSQGGRLVTTVARIPNNKVLQLRIWLRKYPVALISTCTLVGWFLLSIAMYIAEEGILNFADCMWLTFITMTTVGYGDLSPNTQVGRAVACVTALHGLLSSALLINVVTSFFTLDSQQERVLEFMTEAKLTSKVEKYAVLIIETSYLAKKYPDDWHLKYSKKHLCYQFRKLKRHLKMFKAEMHLTIEPVDLDSKIMILDRKINLLCESQALAIGPSLEMEDSLPSSSPKKNDAFQTINRMLEAIADKQDAMQVRQDKLEEILLQLVQQKETTKARETSGSDALVTEGS
eukprot:TRINITY_DN1915_c0_g4_i1.p1 TRINITY_DN1915_c0_g4~~TRINITY_DN1915_c0_g4_i1.p1  ORF type:complete len:520 (+),score=179.97 TRINITY_DN1915_c0_g4_i1:34-1560(+)